MNDDSFYVRPGTGYRVNTQRKEGYDLKSIFCRITSFILTLTCPIGLPSHTPVAQKNAELCTLIASLVKRLFVRFDWTERLRDDSSATD